MTIKVERMRSKASSLRKAAFTPTAGAGDTDQILLTLADELDRNAESLEREATAKGERDR